MTATASVNDGTSDTTRRGGRASVGSSATVTDRIVPHRSRAVAVSAPAAPARPVW
ncbi:hypothetical protein GCM10010201_32960 [Pilimelia columellifera subsp. columellifera]|uniref:Uncharacterized protein n=1 Tax=Pilimelia columellifera subsp. columellifera TaxID=706583 RepID=A0ABP6B321_9ACTN